MFYTGKLGQRSDFVKTVIVTSAKQYEAIIAKNEIVSQIRVMKDRILVSYRKRQDEKSDPGQTAVAIAAHVTSYARIELYKKMAAIGLVAEWENDDYREFVFNGKLCYVDTDSLIYAATPEEEEELIAKGFKFGNNLGNLADEVYKATGNADAYIHEVVALGPKSYSLRYHEPQHDGTIKIRDVTKAKGITISRATGDTINFDEFKKKTKEYLTSKTTQNIATKVRQTKWTIDRGDEIKPRKVVTTESTKQQRITGGKRMIYFSNENKYQERDGWTYEIGYCGHDFSRIPPAQIFGNYDHRFMDEEDLTLFTSHTYLTETL